MTALAEAVESGTLCACGCGEPVNPLAEMVRERRERRLTFVRIARELGITAQYARTLARKPPKYVKGHQSRVVEWLTVVCQGCGEEFRTTAATGRTYCNTRYCSSSRGRGAAYDQFIARLDEIEERDRRQKREAVQLERHLWRPPTVWDFDHRFAVLAERERLAAYEEAKADPILAGLVAQQSADDKFGDYVEHKWLLCLDQRFKSRLRPDETTGSLADLLEAPDAEPLAAMVADQEAEERRRLLGQMTEEHVARLDDHTLEHLREELRALGMAPHGVQRKERERLKNPARHRGGGPPSTFQPIHSKRRNRREQQALMSGKRISRKQRGKGRRARKEVDVW